MKRSILATILALVIPSSNGVGAEPPTTNHWSFKPVVTPPVPVVRNKAWPRNAIDHFILEKLETSGLSPAKEAERAILIRRLKFDLLGLPPTPEEIDEFVGDKAVDAFEKRVDRYLASPQFGERWARHWLDVVRFAESDGFETNLARPNAWPYRDYVIRSFNEDKPYDRFVREQLAGDALFAQEGTGFLVAGPWDRVKSPDPVLTAQQRADELHDMVSTTASTFLGLTVGCARCHDHKFDPISQKDYHGIKAVLAGVQHGERPLPMSGTILKKIEALKKEQADLVVEISDLEPLANVKSGTRRRLQVNAVRNIDRFAPVLAKYIRFTINKTTAGEPCIDELEIWTVGPQSRNIALGAKATSSGNLPGYPIHKLEHINDGLYGNSHSWISDVGGRGWVQIDLKEPAKIDRVVWGRDREGTYADRLAVGYSIEIAVERDRWQAVATSDDRALMGKPATEPWGETEAQRQTWKRLTERQAELKKQIKLLEGPGGSAYVGKFTTPETVHLLHRGDPTQKREEVKPSALSCFDQKMNLSAEANHQQRRIALADWIVDARNPMTARVIVNRLWHYHFGTGIVATPSDLGRNGLPPSHRELLDWLAGELMANKWSLKHLHRLIVTSAAYRQSSAANEIALKKDAQNRLLWRYPPRRLEAEALRDSILFVSGKLDLAMGGPGFDLFEPSTNYVKVYTPKKEFGPAEFRRMIYQSKPRMQLDNTFGAFDCPDGGQITPMRNTSTTPLQALNLLNSPFLQQQATFFAERVVQEMGPDVPKQVHRAFTLAFQREPTREELQAAVGLVKEHGLPALCRVLFNTNEFLFVY